MEKAAKLKKSKPQTINIETVKVDENTFKGKKK